VAELMTLEEVAEYLRVTKKTVYRLLERRAIPSTRVGHQWRFDKAAIEAWLRHNSAGFAANFLVIDDDEAIGDLIKDTLEEAGHVVTTTTDSARGLQLAREKSYDLVFLDLKMPGMDGTEVFKEIRAEKPEMPVVIVTGYADSDLMMTALDNGPFGVMKKPFTGSEVMTVVRTYLRVGFPVMA
jgi:excisionase family DNA binding protein